MKKKLIEQSRLIQQISQILKSLHNVGDALSTLLETLGKYTGVNRVFFYHVFKSDQTGKLLMTLSYEWVVSPEEQQLGRPWTKNIPLQDAFSRWFVKMRPLTVIEARPDDFTSDELQYLDLIGVGNLLFIPLFVGNDLWGLFGLVVADGNYSWDETDKNLLVTVGNMIEMFLEIQYAEQEKSKSLLHFKLLADNTGDIICLHTATGDFTYISPSVHSVLGYSPDELLGKSPVSYVHPKFKAMVSRFYLEINASGNPIENAMYQFKHKQGHYRWLETGVTQFVADGEKRFITVSRDVTQRKKIELELEESETKLKSILNSIDDIIYATEFYTGKILYLNSSCETVLQFTAEELIGNPDLLRSIILEEDRANVDVLFKGIMEQGALAHGSFFDISYRIRTKSGEVKWVNNKFRIRFNKMYDTLIHEGTISDVSQQMLIQGVMIDSLKKEKQLNDMKNQFIAYTSHQFKTPISAIVSSAELLKSYWQRWDTAKREKHLERIVGTGQQLAQMITDLTELQKIDAIGSKSDFRNILLYSYLSDLSETLSPLKKKGQKLKISGERNAIVLANEDLLYQVFENIITNAIKFSPEGTTVHISVFTIEGNVTVAIADQGIGVPQKEMERLFEPFYRGGNTVGITGSGLGLTIAGRALAHLSGSISVSGNEPQGSVFTVTFVQEKLIEEHNNVYKYEPKH